MATASLKITHLASVRKLTIPLSIMWNDLEEQIRTIFSIPSGTSFLLRYRDDEGDLITLNSDLEFEQILCSGAHVKFLLTLPQDEDDQQSIDWDASSIDTISEEPVLVQQENEEDMVDLIDLETDELQSESIADDMKGEKKTNEDVEVESNILTNRSMESANLHLSLEQQNKQQSSQGASTNEEQLQVPNEKQSNIQDQLTISSIENFSTKFEQIIKKSHDVLIKNPDMLTTANSLMDHILENTPMYIEFVLNWLNSVKNQSQSTNTNQISNDASTFQRDQENDLPNMPGSFPISTPLFQFSQSLLHGDHLPSVSCRRDLPLSPLLSHMSSSPPAPLGPPPPPPPGPRFNASQFTSPQPFPPFPGSFPSMRNDNQDQSPVTQHFSAELADLHDMGFTDSEQNDSLLRKYNGNLDSVIESILSQKDSISASTAVPFISRKDRPISYV